MLTSYQIEEQIIQLKNNIATQEELIKMNTLLGKSLGKSLSSLPILQAIATSQGTIATLEMHISLLRLYQLNLSK